MSERPRLAQHSIPGRRPYQEDSIHADTLSDGRILVAVADGMGGHAAGEVASALALETLKASLEAGIELGEAFRLANQQVHTKSKEPGKQGMGTTMVAVLLDEDQYLVANVGDSRGYLLSGDGIRRITQDHSFVAEAMKRGQSEEEATASQWRDALTRAIGTDASVEVDVFGPFPVEKNAAFLLCSDGLYKTLKDADLRGIFGRSGGPKGAAQTLVAAAYDRGSDDNISVVIAEFGQVPREQAQGTMPLEFVPPELEGEPSAEEGEPGGDDPGPEEQGKGSWWQRWRK
ncbi:MAG: protein phosphatase 2C domain-containing protein [Longimicrobiales bacterium]|nr:protein phosphatase 2C domain-containing protein [Longimicrobiales bacterium]